MSLLDKTADVAKDLAFALLGEIDQIKIGDIIVSACERIQAPSELRITRKTIGAGYPITDAAVKQPRDISLDIVFVDPQYSLDELKTSLLTGDVSNLIEGWRDRKDALQDYQDNLEIISLQTHENIYENMLVTLIDPVYNADDNWDGFFATVTLSQIKTQAEEEGGLYDSVTDALGEL